METLKTSTDKIIGEKGDGIGWLTFNQPEKRNAMSLEMWQATSEVLEDFAADDAVRVVVMQGAGDKAFVSGADISQFEEKRSNAELAAHYAQISGGAREQLAALRKPLIARIRGFCVGGGLAVALSADLRIAADDAKFGIPAAKLGIVYNFEGIQALTALVGPGNAKKLLYTGYRVDAAEALRMRLIEEVTSVEALDETVLKYARTMVENAPLSINGSKESLRQLARPEAERDIALLKRLASEAMDSADYAEGRKAFMEKRSPVFTGR